MVRALFECQANKCEEKSLVNDTETLPGKWVVVTINQNLFNNEDEEIGTFSYSLEFCGMAHAAEKMSDLELLKARVKTEEETEPNG